MYYLATDLLGSITAIVPAVGNNIEYRSYDAWGRPRNPDDWTYNNVSAFSLIDRGYTFHEHLPEFGLINMNGRMCDPLVARFLSPDPYVQDPGSTQGFNRYSYCLNNPLKYTDPSGEFWHIIIGAVIGGVVNLAVNWNNCESVWQYFAAFGIGAGAGALGAATGGAAFVAAGGAAAGTGGFAAGAISGLMGTAVSAPVQNVGNHVAFGEPIMTSTQYIETIGIGSLTGGALNGTTALVFGKTFMYGLPRATPATTTPTTPAVTPSREQLSTIETKSRPVETISQNRPMPSKNVQEVLSTLDDLKLNGAQIKPNPLDAGNLQELNMTIKHNGIKLDMRIETHKLPIKYGGDGISPIRHMNLDLTPKPNPKLPQGGHKLLP